MSEKTSKTKRRLGRGLSSLVATPVQVESESNDPNFASISIDAIGANPFQPRQEFNDRGIDSLAESIRTAGLMQPIVVRRGPSGSYQLIAGERRWRAARAAGLKTVPAVIREVNDQEAAEFALIENIQREDLNPIERAEAFARLAEQFKMTHQQVAERVGIERSNVTNHLRLLDLDEQIKDAVRSKQLSMGHARALLAFANDERRREIGLECIAAGWSVREIERRVRSLSDTERKEASHGSSSKDDARQLHVEDLQRRLSEELGTKVQVRLGRKKGTGQLTISFYSFDEFDGLLSRLNVQNVVQ